MAGLTFATDIETFNKATDRYQKIAELLTAMGFIRIDRVKKRSYLIFIYLQRATSNSMAEKTFLLGSEWLRAKIIVQNNADFV